MTDSLTRRSMLGAGAAGASLIPFQDWFQRYGGAQAAEPLVRYSVNTIRGGEMLAKYRSVVGRMMTKTAGEPCSWVFQWYTHEVRDNTTKAAQVAALPPAQQPLANDMWDTCQGHFGRPLQYFLPWHRMYVYFLERMVRNLCGDPQFTLPYWNYMDVPQRPIPAGFRSPGNSSNPLYRPDRNDGTSAPSNTGPANVNGGQPIDYSLVPTPLNLDCLKEATYLPAGPAHPGFNSAINQNPHGMVHDLVGNAVGMGSVPWAANDPVFWLHHCNIDRLWASWNRAGRPNPQTSDWRDKPFVFADEHCNKVVVTVQDFAQIAPLGYTYEAFAPVPPPSFNPRLLAAAEGRVLATIRPPTPIGPDPAPFRLSLPADSVRRLRPQALAAARQRVYLVIKGLSAARTPGAIYNVYLDTEGGPLIARGASHYVGAISFFEAVRHEGMENMAGMGGMGAADEGISFDVTDLDRQAARRRAAGRGPARDPLPARPCGRARRNGPGRDFPDRGIGAGRRRGPGPAVHGPLVQRRHAPQPSQPPRHVHAVADQEAVRRLPAGEVGLDGAGEGDRLAGEDGGEHLAGAGLPHDPRALRQRQARLHHVVNQQHAAALHRALDAGPDLHHAGGGAAVGVGGDPEGVEQRIAPAARQGAGQVGGEPDAAGEHADEDALVVDARRDGVGHGLDDGGHLDVRQDFRRRGAAFSHGRRRSAGRRARSSAGAWPPRRRRGRPRRAAAPRRAGRRRPASAPRPLC